jgi:murein DD-endopeptidase MepM/ murein hydrolase activator NlpD
MSIPSRVPLAAALVALLVTPLTCVSGVDPAVAAPPGPPVAAPPGPAPVPPVGALTSPALPLEPAPQARFRWPLDGRPPVVRRFQPPPQPWLPGHRGVDLSAGPAAAVHAAGPGVVRFAGPLAGRGVVSIDHAGGLRTTYEPVAAVVAEGQQVRAGDLIGRAETGHPGCPVVTCLHWGLRRGETYLDPLALVGSGRVRLLPLAGDGREEGR